MLRRLDLPSGWHPSVQRMVLLTEQLPLRADVRPQNQNVERGYLSLW